MAENRFPIILPPLHEEVIAQATKTSLSNTVVKRTLTQTTGKVKIEKKKTLLGLSFRNFMRNSKRLCGTVNLYTFFDFT